MLRCIFVPNLEIVTSIVDESWHGQAQNGVNFDFEVKFDLEGHGQSSPPPPPPPKKKNNKKKQLGTLPRSFQGLSQPKIFTHRQRPLLKPNKTYRLQSPKKDYYVYYLYMYVYIVLCIC